MKKIIVMLIVLSLGVLAGCEKKPKPEPKTPLTPVEDCSVKTLEGGWVCQWADEFDGDSVDESKWNFEVNAGGGGNNELQYYTRNNTVVKDSILSIVAKKESYGNRNYTSSRITTYLKGDFMYGRFQFRAKNPVGRGTWPALWLMPTLSSYGSWPRSGEIDVMEYVGYNPDYVYHTIHTEKFNHKAGTQIGGSKRLPDSNSEFHIYDLIWAPGELTWFIDGEETFRVRYQAALNKDVPYYKAFPFDQKFFIILNLAIGGDWGGVQGVDDSIFPAVFEIDYVRYYKRDYDVLDKEKPGKVEGIDLAGIPNTIYWDVPEDDYGIEYYRIYIDDEYWEDARINQYTFKDGIPGETYRISIRAVDFTGKVGEKSVNFSLTYK